LSDQTDLKLPNHEHGFLINETSEYLLDRAIQETLDDLDGSAPLLARMARYHLGLIDSTGDSTTDEQRRALQGKRIRPAVAFLAAQSVGGAAEAAAPLAAAIELLHNFTLIHDDIQDRSPNRRHRATVWRIWGDAQAINAGDALFASSHLTLLNTATAQLPAESLIELTRNFNRTTIEIVRGQVLDVGFEGRADVTPDDYLEMIAGKTAAIVRFAAEGGAIVGGADPETVAAFAEFGEALGIGFQIRDDLLGIWGDNATTGKTRGDDIRRRKQSLPMLLLRSNATEADLQRLGELSANDEVDDDGISEVFAMLDRYQIRDQMQQHIDQIHDRAMHAFASIGDLHRSDARDDLAALVTRLARRDS
jgi:geranylgeranyl diphosphate synthase type I